MTVPDHMGLGNSEAVDDTWIDAHSMPFPNRESCVGGIEFPLDVHYGRMMEYIMAGLATGNLDAVKAKSAMLAVGLEDHAIHPENQISDFRALFPDAPLVTLPGVGHFCQEDAPETLVALIQQFIQSNP